MNKCIQTWLRCTTRKIFNKFKVCGYFLSLPTVSDRKNNFAEHQTCYLQNILVFQFDLQLSFKLVLDKSLP